MTAKKIPYVLYAALSYTIGMAALLYLIGFVIDAPLPKTVDHGPRVSRQGEGVLWNVAVLLAFLVPHSVMARPRFKTWWTRMIPAALERATYVLVSGVSTFGMIAAWQPLRQTIWEVETPAVRLLLLAGYALAWLTILFATFNIDHFSFFGLRQIWHAFVERPLPRPTFTARWLYAWVRHPISLGWLLVFWTTPHMTLGHLALAVVMSLYIVIVTPLEEADLVDELGDDYRAYRTRVRRFLPWPRPPKPSAPERHARSS